MAQQQPHSITVNAGSMENSIFPIFKVPDNFGGISIQEAHITFGVAGTAELYLINAGAVGTSTGSDGTLATYGGTAYTALTPSEMTINNAYIGAGSYVALKEANTGTSDGTTLVSMTFLYGK